MFTNNFDPVAFQIFSLEIRWYSLAYIFGISLGWMYCKKKLIQNKYILDIFDDYITYVIVGIILGGRIGYALFYNLKFYLENPVEILMIWNGGMSFHGGLIGIIVVSVLFAKKYNQDSFLYMDLVALVAPIGIFFGRIANFINSELYGIPTEVPWGVIFVQIDKFARHPSQLYEAFLEGVTLFIIMNLIILKGNYKIGTCSSMFLIIYGFFRIFGEQFREPDSQIGYLFNFLSMGSLLSVIMIGFGTILYFKVKNEH